MPNPTKTHLLKRAGLSGLASLAALGLLAAGLCVGGLGCDQAEPTIAESFNKAEFYAGDSDDLPSRKDALIADIKGAKDSVDIAVSTLEDEDVAQALIDAHSAGVKVRVVSDWDSWADSDGPDAGLELLEEAGIEPVYGDGPISYLPEPNLASLLGQCWERNGGHYIFCTRGGGGQGAMERPGHYNLMSHNFAIVDQFTVWNFPAFDTLTKPWLGWRIQSSVLAYDFLHEFQQMHGGVFSTTLDVYNGPVKSTTDGNISYFTDQGELRLWFNPQERLMKLIIDQVYKAKASIWVMSDNLANPELIKALEYKHENGFDVRVMIHPDHQMGDSTMDRLDALGAKSAPADLDHLPTLLVLDEERDRNNDKRPRSVMALSHSLLYASPYEVLLPKSGDPNDPDPRADNVHIYPSDLFADGNLWQLIESGAMTHRDEVIDQYVAQWLAVWNQ